MIQIHARDQSNKDSESENDAVPAMSVGQSGVEAQHSINARPVAAENNNKRTCEELEDNSLEVRAIKHPHVMSLTDIECDQDKLEESDLIFAPNSHWEATEAF